MSSNTIHATTGTFDEEVFKSTIPVVVDFWAPWCGPCRVVGPLLDQLADEYAGRVKVVKLNVDEEPEIAEKFRVSGIPTIVAFRDGDVADVQVGAGGRPQLVDFFERMLADQPQMQASA